MTLQNHTEFSPKQTRALRALALGNTVTQAAIESGYSRGHLSRLASGPGRIELERLRREAEAILASELPEIVKLAVQQLCSDLQSKNWDIRHRTMKLVMRTFAPVLMRAMQLDEAFVPVLNIIQSGNSSTIDQQVITEIVPNDYKDSYIDMQDLDTKALSLLADLVAAQEMDDLRSRLAALLDQLPDIHPLKVELIQAQAVDSWTVWQTAAKWGKRYRLKPNSNSVGTTTDQ